MFENFLVFIKGETFSARQKTVAGQLLPITKYNRVSNMGDR